jgi:phosphoenolpyruvate carboxylase
MEATDRALAEVRGRIRPREAELAQLRQQRDKIVTAQRDTSADELRAVLATLADNLRSEHIPLARRALVTIVDAVELRGYDITIRYK